MKTKLALGISLCVASLVFSNAASGQLLYSENFDTDSTSNWQINASAVTDSAADFFFDYSTVGIPPAPGSATTRGMKLQANLFSDVFGGFSVSPIDQNFEGDYALTFDVWANTIGPLPGGGSGSTNLSQFGIMTSGTVTVSPGSGDGVWFGMVGDGNTASDYRAYSVERVVSYQVPPDLDPTSPNYCANDCDLHATYLAESRNSSATLYAENFSPATNPVSPPEAQTALFPATQTGTLAPGAPGFAWRHAEIKKEGNLVSWSLDGILLITVDMTDFNTPVGGGNILFGHSDINDGSTLDPDGPALIFTLIDNIEVNQLTPGGVEDADFDGNGFVDGRDFLTWQRGFGIDDGTAQLGDGDANEDGKVDGADLAIWQAQYGTNPIAAVAAVPEPATIVAVLFATALIGLGRRKL